MNKSKLLNVINEILNENERQFEKWGQQDHDPDRWITILLEEVGEASRCAVDFIHVNDVISPEGNLVPPKEKHQAGRLQQYREEMIQVAAVAVQIITSIDRNYHDLLFMDLGDPF